MEVRSKKRLKLKALSLFLCLAALIPFCLSCGGDGPDAAASAVVTETDPDEGKLILFDGSGWKYSVLAKKGRGEIYGRALEELLSLFSSAFGSAPAVVYEESGEENAPEEAGEKTGEKTDPRLLIFGDIPERDAFAKERLGTKGICVCASDDGDIALLATEEHLLSDLVDLFSSRVKKSKTGKLAIEKDLCLVRPFTGISFIDGENYDFTLPVMSIATENGQEITSRSTYIGASVSLCNTYENYAMDKVTAKIRGRGNGTWDNVKKRPYKLKFESKVDLLGISHSPDRDYILMSNPLDYTNLRNALCFTLAGCCFDRIEYTSNYTFVNFFLNGVYRGIYMICEQNEASSGRIRVKEDEDPEKSEYLVELDAYCTKDGLIRGVEYFSSGGKNFRIRSDMNSAERCDYVKTVYDGFFNVVRKRQQSEIEKYIDVDSAVDMYLLQEFMKNTDVGWSSFYMVLRADHKIYFTAPWDFDLSSGNDYRVDNGSYKGLYVGTDYNMGQSSPIFYKLMECTWFRSLVEKRWAELSDRVLETSLKLIDDTLLYREGDLLADISKRVAGAGRSDDKNHSNSRTPSKVLTDNMEYLSNWLKNRREWLDAEFEVPEK